VANLQTSVDALLASGQAPADPGALAATLAALNDLLASLPAGVDPGAIDNAVANLTGTANLLLGPTGTPPVVQRGVPGIPLPRPVTPASGVLPGASGRPGRLTIVTRRARLRNGKVKVRVVCALASAGCVGSLRTYSRVGRLPSTGRRVARLAAGNGRTVTLRFNRRAVRRLRADRKLRLVVLSTGAGTAAKRRGPRARSS